MALSEAGKDVIGTTKIIEEIGMRMNYPISVKIDNDAARLAVQRPGQTSRTRHVEVRHFWIREKITNGSFKVERISTDDNIADIGTKPLPSKRFETLRDELMNKIPETKQDPKKTKTDKQK